MTIPSVRMLAAAILLSTSLTTLAIPMSYKIERRGVQCLYDYFEDKDYATISVAILSGASLTAQAKFSGPICENDGTVTGHSLYQASRTFNPNRLETGQRHEEYHVDYETMHDGHDDDYEDDDELIHDDDIDFDDDDMDDITFQDYYYEMDDDDDEEYMFMEDDMMGPDEINEIRERKKIHDQMTPEEREKTKEERKIRNREEAKERFEKRKARKAKRDEKKDKILQAKAARREMTSAEKMADNMKSGRAHETTYKIRKGGWYMVCIESYGNSITAEIEMRKSGDVGPISKKTGHLSTYERHEMIQREKRMFGIDRLERQKEMEAELERAKKVGDSNLPIPNAIKEHDLHTSRHQMQNLNRLLNEIREKQQDERHRILQHTTLNQHSHGRMVLSSLFETVFYIAVSGFQVYTIRRWFKGNPILGY